MEDLKLAGKRVLVVDDLEQNIDILTQFLKPMHFEIRGVRSGEEALAAVEQDPPDVILLDLAMPGMNGFQVCRHLKQSEHTRHIPVIIITGISDKQANVEAVEAGADDFLIKPFDRVLLEAPINRSSRIGWRSERSNWS